MNEISKAIMDQVAMARKEMDDWTDWSNKTMEEIREGLEIFHGMGKIRIVSIQDKNRMEVWNGKEFRFSVELKQGYVEFNHWQQQHAMALKDQTLLALTIRHMATVVAEQNV